MAKNRRLRPRDEKRAELVAAARSLFLEHGYEKTSIGKVAQAAGVAPNTIYWYFEDKDALLLAAADEFLQAVLEDYASVQDRPLVDQMGWLVDHLRPVKEIVTTIHQRSAVSPHVAQWHEGFHAAFEHLFEAQLPAPLDPATRAADVVVAAFALEGVIMHDLGPEASRGVYEALLARAGVPGDADGCDAGGQPQTGSMIR